MEKMGPKALKKNLGFLGNNTEANEACLQEFFGAVLWGWGGLRKKYRSCFQDSFQDLCSPHVKGVSGKNKDKSYQIGPSQKFGHKNKLISFCLKDDIIKNSKTISTFLILEQFVTIKVTWDEIHQGKNLLFG